MNDKDIRTRARDIMEQAVTSVLMTVDANGFPHPRTMWTAGIDDDFTIYYVTGRNMQKDQQIQANPRVCSYWTMVEDGKIGWSYVLLKGEASLEDNSQLRDRFWDESLTRYFPQGKNDPNMVFIVIKPRELMMMDGYKYPLDRIEF